MFPDLCRNFPDKFLTRPTRKLDLGFKILIYLRLQILKSQIIKLCLDFGDTQTVCQRRIDLDRFPGLFLLLLRLHILKGPHIVETVCQLNENNPDVLSHCKEHFSQVFSLHLHLVSRP